MIKHIWMIGDTKEFDLSYLIDHLYEYKNKVNRMHNTEYGFTTLLVDNTVHALGVVNKNFNYESKLQSVSVFPNTTVKDIKCNEVYVNFKGDYYEIE